MNLKITIAYDGGAYVGWQRQPNGLSVQEKIEEVLGRLSGSRVVLHGASRTDTGVHALGMVAHFEWIRKRPAWSELLRALNALLPEDVRVLKVEKVPKKFHSRFNARWKLYRYRILNSEIGDPFRRTVSWWILKELDLKAMNRAACYFIGKHDFSGVTVNPGYERESMVRTIRKCRGIRRKDEIHFEVEGDGFLYKMVRTMVGTLVEVGMGRRSVESVRDLIISKDRRKAGKTAPPQGLFLVKVDY